MGTVNTNLFNYCMSYVQETYLKIIRINFTDGSFEVCRNDEGLEIPQVKTFLEWIKYCVENDLIHAEDINKFNTFANVENLRKWVAENDKGLYCSYRRKDKSGGYIHASICLIRDKENYNKDHEYGLLFVKDINSIYLAEYECILEDLGTKDSFTNLLNRYAYQRDIAKYSGGCVGVIFADINGLKFTNDTYGHAAGDKLILNFANLLKRAFADYKIYHISGDEFIVVAYDVNLRSFLQRALGWHRWLWETGDYPLGAVGYSLDSEVKNIEELVTEAENAMYVDKDIFYSRYPQYKRK